MASLGSMSLEQMTVSATSIDMVFGLSNLTLKAWTIYMMLIVMMKIVIVMMT